MSDNSWFEEGELPPVGSIVEFCNKKKEKERICIDDWKNGDKLEVLAIRKVGLSDLPIVFNLRDNTASAVIMEMIRPIKTERELAIEAMHLIANQNGSCANICAMEKLYDAGYRKNES